MKYLSQFALFVLIGISLTAHAGSTDLTGLKLPCATFKLGKLIQKTTCTVLDGIESGNAFGVGVDMVLKPAKAPNARKPIHITHRITNKTHPDGSVMYDDDYNLVVENIKSTLNDTLATMHYRHNRTLTIMNDNPDLTHYHCFVSKQNKGFDEFCVMREF